MCIFDCLFLAKIKFSFERLLFSRINIYIESIFTKLISEDLEINRRSDFYLKV